MSLSSDLASSIICSLDMVWSLNVEFDFKFPDAIYKLIVRLWEFCCFGSKLLPLLFRWCTVSLLLTSSGIRLTGLSFWPIMKSLNPSIPSAGHPFGFFIRNGFDLWPLSGCCWFSTLTAGDPYALSPLARKFLLVFSDSTFGDVATEVSSDSVVTMLETRDIIFCIECWPENWPDWLRGICNGC